MGIPMRHVRPIGNKTKYVAKGRTDFTGQYDPTQYEIILGPPPDNAVSTEAFQPEDDPKNQAIDFLLEKISLDAADEAKRTELINKLT